MDWPGSTQEAALRPLDPRVIPYWRIHSVIHSGLLFFVALIAGLVLVMNLPEAIPWVVCGWLFLFLYRVGLLIWYPPAAYRAWGYRVTDKILETRRGIWFRTITLLPLSRLQHVDLQRGPLERAFGLASLRLFTAGTQHASIGVPGLDAGAASTLRDLLVAAGGNDAA